MAISMIVVGMAVEGYLRKPIQLLPRPVLLAAGILFLFVDPWFFALGLVLTVAGVLPQWMGGADVETEP